MQNIAILRKYTEVYGIKGHDTCNILSSGSEIKIIIHTHPERMMKSIWHKVKNW